MLVKLNDNIFVFAEYTLYWHIRAPKGLITAHFTSLSLSLSLSVSLPPSVCLSIESIFRIRYPLSVVGICEDDVQLQLLRLAVLIKFSLCTCSPLIIITCLPHQTKSCHSSLKNSQLCTQRGRISATACGQNSVQQRRCQLSWTFLLYGLLFLQAVSLLLCVITDDSKLALLIFCLSLLG